MVSPFGYLFYIGFNKENGVKIMRQNFILPTHIVTVGAVIENSKNEILMVKAYDNGWTFPAEQV